MVLALEKLRLLLRNLRLQVRHLVRELRAGLVHVRERLELYLELAVLATDVLLRSRRPNLLEPVERLLKPRVLRA